MICDSGVRPHDTIVWIKVIFLSLCSSIVAADFIHLADHSSEISNFRYLRRWEWHLKTVAMMEAAFNTNFDAW
jgi:hypothetical protein